MPLLLRERRRRASRTARRPTLFHDDRRVAAHRFWPLDRERVWLANRAIGWPWWAGLFGDPRAALSYYVPSNIVRFPERRSQIAKLRAEIEELRRAV
jgi:hypothetical protein